MSPLAACGFAGLTACMLIRIAISIAHDIHDRRPHHARSHGNHRTSKGGR